MTYRSRRLEDLGPSRVEDLRDAQWFQFAAEIEELRNDSATAWAAHVLARIQAEVLRTHVVTAQQVRAIERIKAAERTPSRNFDAWGFGRRWR